MKIRRSRDAAIAAAFREAKKLLLERKRVCIQLFAGARFISLMEVRGGTRVPLLRVGWSETEG